MAVAVVAASSCGASSSATRSPGSGSSSSSSSGASGPDGSPGASGGVQAAACVGTSSAAMKQPLALYLMLDRSGSMEETSGGAATKWGAISYALFSFLDQPLTGTSLGLQYFPNAASTTMADNSCRALDYSTPEVEIGELAATAPLVKASISATSRSVGTPTSAALQGAIDQARAWASKPENAGKTAAVVLATDGLPTTCATDLAAVNAIAAAGVSGSPSVRSFVIGVGSALQNLNGIAAAGGTSAAHLVATNGTVSAEFLKALNDIRVKAVACSYAIPKPPAGQTLDFAQVNVEYTPASGAKVRFTQVASAAACGTRTGAWHYDDALAPRTMTLCPGTCARVEADSGTAATASLQIVLGCATTGEHDGVSSGGTSSSGTSSSGGEHDGVSSGGTSSSGSSSSGTSSSGGVEW